MRCFVFQYPPPLDYLLAYGLIFPFVLAGVYRVLKYSIPGSAFMVGWLVLLPVLAYAPYPLQRRLPEGIWVCMVILAILAVSSDARQVICRRLQPVLYIGVLSSIVLYAGSIGAVFTPQTPLYIPVEEVNAFAMIEKEAANHFRLSWLTIQAAMRCLPGRPFERSSVMDLKVKT